MLTPSQVRLLAGSPAHRPRLSTDSLFLPPPGSFQYTGPLDEAVRFIQEHQLLDAELWARFVRQFRTEADKDLGWRCEYWGKLMRGGSLIYAYTQDARLYRQLEDTLRDMLTAQDPLGRFSCYPVEVEFQGWDLWGRKYILLGMEFFYDICQDQALKAQTLEAMLRHAGYILEHIGPGPGQKDIRQTSNFWEGMNSSSLLEPIILLYNMTGEQRLLNFAGYIVEQGGILSANLFRLALEDKLEPWQYPVTKAYEMMSCFEGLLEYARAAGKPEWAQAAVNFGRRVMDSDITIIGSAGCTHELFDHSWLGQADPAFTGIMQETCVTVTWMKLCCQLLLYTGEPVFADHIERSAYNALLGAVNRNQVPRDPLSPNGWLPFDSYSPLRAGCRGQAVGGRMVMADNTIYGCCAAIGAAGLGMAPAASALLRRDGLALCLYLPGVMSLPAPSGQKLQLTVDTGYPVEEQVILSLSLAEPEEFTLALRCPEWCAAPQAALNGSALSANPGWLELTRTWRDGDRIELVFPMEVRALGSWQLGPDGEALPPHVALCRGPLVLAREQSLGGAAAGSPVHFQNNEKGWVAAHRAKSDELPFPAMLGVWAETAEGPLLLADYASTGQDYDQAMEAWMPTSRQ